MNYKENLNKEIELYWWNMGAKTLDYRGSYAGYFKKRGIRITTVKHPNQDIRGMRFHISTSSNRATLDSFAGEYDHAQIQAFDDAIKIFLTLMGDKVRFSNGYGHIYKINYR